MRIGHRDDDLAGRPALRGPSDTGVDRVLMLVARQPDGLAALRESQEPLGRELVPGGDVGQHLLSRPLAVTEAGGELLVVEGTDPFAEGAPALVHAAERVAHERLVRGPERHSPGGRRSRWLKNSARVRSRVRNRPSTADVVMTVPGLRMPRITA